MGVSGLTPDQVIEIKHGFAGIAEVTRSFYESLRKEGFLHHDAMQLSQAWMVSVLTQTSGSEDDGE